MHCFFFFGHAVIDYNLNVLIYLTVSFILLLLNSLVSIVFCQDV